MNDPFAAPNTYSSNPGNDLGVLDFGHEDGMLVYAYGTNLDVDAPMNSATFASKKTKHGNYKAVLVSE
ncbi:MAG: hypothetical protein HY842_06830 [Bacteroidetes bacterium]|nr:hypothetical protein [Bacteroidota bacterium]